MQQLEVERKSFPQINPSALNHHHHRQSISEQLNLKALRCGMESLWEKSYTLNKEFHEFSLKNQTDTKFEIQQIILPQSKFEHDVRIYFQNPDMLKYCDGGGYSFTRVTMNAVFIGFLSIILQG